MEKLTSLAKLNKTLTQYRMVQVYFTASWCGPCQMIKPHANHLACDNPHVKYFMVDVDDDPEDLADKFKITGMPTFVFIKIGTEVDRLVGADLNALQFKTQLNFRN